MEFRRAERTPATALEKHQGLRPRPPAGQAVRLGDAITLQKTVGNAAASRVLAEHRNPPALQRQPPSRRPGPQAPYVANPAVLADCVSLLQRVYATQSAATLAVLRRWRTVAIGAVVDPDEPNVTKYHWTASGNWNDPTVAAAMAELGVRRWDAEPSRMARGAQGAPGDAEQRMMSGDDILKAIAVSRPPCGDCAAALADYGSEHGHVLLAVVPPPTEQEQQARRRAVDGIQAALQRIRQQLELYEGEHRAQAALINEPSFSGFAGYWTNRLFNKEVPPPTIWVNAYGAALAVESALAQGDLRAATVNLMRARTQLAVALRRYASWKDGIEAAGTTAQIAIGVVALATVAAVVAGPLVVEALIEVFAGGAAEAGAGASEAQTAVRIAEVITRYDQAVLVMEEAATEAEIQALAAEEAEAFFASLGL